MNLNDLKLFEAVVHYGSFTKAAEVMFTVQSNVTARIKRLEREFGTTLFVRTPRKVELTAAGKSMLNYSKQINNLLEAAKLSLSKDQPVKGEFRLGFLETTLTQQGPKVVNRMAEAYPLINLHLTSGMRDTLVCQVLNYQLDAALIPGPIRHEELEQLPINDERIVIVTPMHIHTLEDLLAQPQVKVVVSSEGCFFRARLEAWLMSHNIMDYHKTVVNSVEGVISFIESGIGFSMLPEEIISTFYSGRKVRMLPLQNEIGTFSNTLIYRKESATSPILNAFIGLFHT